MAVPVLPAVVAWWSSLGLSGKAIAVSLVAWTGWELFSDDDKETLKTAKTPEELEKRLPDTVKAQLEAIGRATDEGLKSGAITAESTPEELNKYLEGAQKAKTSMGLEKDRIGLGALKRREEIEVEDHNARFMTDDQRSKVKQQKGDLSYHDTQHETRARYLYDKKFGQGRFDDLEGQARLDAMNAYKPATASPGGQMSHGQQATRGIKTARSNQVNRHLANQARTRSLDDPSYPRQTWDKDTDDYNDNGIRDGAEPGFDPAEHDPKHPRHTKYKEQKSLEQPGAIGARRGQTWREENAEKLGLTPTPKPQTLEKPAPAKKEEKIPYQKPGNQGTGYQGPTGEGGPSGRKGEELRPWVKDLFGIKDEPDPGSTGGKITPKPPSKPKNADGYTIDKDLQQMKEGANTSNPNIHIPDMPETTLPDDFERHTGMTPQERLHSLRPTNWKHKYPNRFNQDNKPFKEALGDYEASLENYYRQNHMPSIAAADGKITPREQRQLAEWAKYSKQDDFYGKEWIDRMLANGMSPDDIIKRMVRETGNTGPGTSLRGGQIIQPNPKQTRTVSVMEGDDDSYGPDIMNTVQSRQGHRVQYPQKNRGNILHPNTLRNKAKRIQDKDGNWIDATKEITTGVDDSDVERARQYLFPNQPASKPTLEAPAPAPEPAPEPEAPDTRESMVEYDPITGTYAPKTHWMNQDQGKYEPPPLEYGTTAPEIGEPAPYEPPVEPTAGPMEMPDDLNAFPGPDVTPQPMEFEQETDPLIAGEPPAKPEVNLTEGAMPMPDDLNAFPGPDMSPAPDPIPEGAVDWTKVPTPGTEVDPSGKLTHLAPQPGEAQNAGPQDVPGADIPNQGNPVPDPAIMGANATDPQPMAGAPNMDLPAAPELPDPGMPQNLELKPGEIPEPDPLEGQMEHTVPPGVVFNDPKDRIPDPLTPGETPEPDPLEGQMEHTVPPGVVFNDPKDRMPGQGDSGQMSLDTLEKPAQPLTPGETPEPDPLEGQMEHTVPPGVVFNDPKDRIPQPLTPGEAPEPAPVDPEIPYRYPKDKKGRPLMFVPDNWDGDEQNLLPYPGGDPRNDDPDAPPPEESPFEPLPGQIMPNNEPYVPGDDPADYAALELPPVADPAGQDSIPGSTGELPGPQNPVPDQESAPQPAPQPQPAPAQPQPQPQPQPAPDGVEARPGSQQSPGRDRYWRALTDYYSDTSRSNQAATQQQMGRPLYQRPVSHQAGGGTMINNDNDYINRNMDGTLQRTPGMDRDREGGGQIVALRDHPTRGYNNSEYDQNFEGSGLDPMQYARLSRYNEADLSAARKNKWEQERYFMEEAQKLERLLGGSTFGGRYRPAYDHSKFLAEDPKKVKFLHEIPGHEGIQRGPENSFAESNREIKDIIDQVAQGKAKQAQRAASLNSRPPVARPPVGTHASLDQPIASPAGGYADEYERNMTTAEGLDAENARRGGNPYEHQSTLIGLDYPNSPQDQLGWQMSALDRNLDNAISMGNSYIQDREEEEERKRQAEANKALYNPAGFTVAKNNF